MLNIRIIVFVALVTKTINGNDDVYADQPKIITQDGHLIFMTADNHNITFKSKGKGSIRINDDDLAAVVSSAKQSITEMDTIKNDDIASMRQSIEQLQNRLSNFHSMESRLNDIEETVRQIQGQLSGNGTRLSEVARSQTQLTRQLQVLRNRFNQVKQLLEKKECNSNPCRNGGTCIDGYNSYTCRCPPNFEGQTCESDVNECQEFIGTLHGCQNGATCTNTVGSYSCQCPPDWYGVHCTERHDDCTSASTQALCSHGTCVNQERVLPGQSRFTCICDQGWTTDGRTPACDVDIDECQSGPACSVQPLVQCINIPGSFVCGPCPAGYSGNGFSCTDVDECLVNNGGCSMSPRVQCINAPGSRQCGQCPAGYQGDGFHCTFVGLCSMNNGGCHPLATCTENTAISSTYRECRCPPGYSGSGFGIIGCVIQSGGTAGALTPAPFSPCDANPCIRGTCVATGPYAFRCNCPIGYTGTRCEFDADECASSPCVNGGKCVDQPNGYICQCSAHHTGTNCERDVDVCGEHVQEPNGTLHYPSDSSLTYQNDRSCAWIITTNPGKVLNITFTEFHLEESADCEYDFLQVNDGNSAGNHVIGRFCGRNPPRGGNIISTHNAIYLWFHSDSSVAGDGFQFKWETIDPICGGDMPEGNHGVIISPGYPGQYPINRDCVWTIRVPLRKRIQISFATLQLEHHDSCAYDFLEIRDGLLETDPILGNYCGMETVPPQPLQSSSSFARIYFHTDATRSSIGFHITYSSVPSVHGCGGLLTTESGALSSPDHPNPYSHNLECEWLIRVPPNERIRLSFVSFDTEAHDTCRFDYVAIYDGSDETAPQIGRHCGHNLPPVHLSSSNTLFVKFRTDYSVALDGFQARYTVVKDGFQSHPDLTAFVCGGMFTEPNGLIHSPYYPQSYPASRECIYIIRQDPGKAIELRFIAFSIEGSTNCRFDYLVVRDGDTEASPQINRLCGNVMPAPIISTYNALWLQFKSDGSLQNNGFLANFSTIDIACGGILTDISGIITSPNHPGEYLHSVTCRWIIKPPDGHVVRLTFTTFALEHHPNCAFDYLAVYDNTTTEDESKLIRRYCGNNLPPILTSLDNLVLVVFHSDLSVARDGFAIHYIAFDATTFCGGSHFTTVGVIRSPNFPNGYPHSKICTWKIEVPTGQQVILNITRFELESHRDCAYDYVEIRNGGYVTSPLIGRYCGTVAPSIIPSHGNQILIEFDSDHSMTAPGFEIVWDGATTGCGGALTSSQGSIISPNYPQWCSSDLDCTWRIIVSRGNKIKILFTDLDLPTTENCIQGLEIYNGRSTKSPLMRRICGNSIPDVLISDTNEIFIRYRCNGWRSTRRGFHLFYETVCRVQLNGRRGVIETPNFPNPYPHERNCSWLIQGPSGNKINMSFAMLQLEEAPDCRYDFIEVFTNQNRTSLGRFCGAGQVPRKLSSSTNIATVTFVSDSTFGYNGFSMEWVASGCGGEFRKPSGTFSTPNYPRPYPPLTTCDWEITAEPGQSIELTVQEYDMEGSYNCIYDSLKVYGGRSPRAPLLTSLCHRQTSPVIITSSGNHMYVRFKSDSSRSGRGFNASYVIKSDGCGGTFTLNKGTIHSRNFPDHYSVRDDCSWHVTVTKGHAVHLLFKNFDVQPDTNCSAVYVAVYDGPDEFSPLLVKHCGSHLPANNPFISSDNELLIQMKAHESISATGFQAEYKMTCGAVLYADVPGDISIMSQSFASVLPSNCSWIIHARNLEDRVTLMFTFLEILRSPLNCTHHLIEIYDGEQSDSPLLMGICSPDIPAAITSRGSSLRVVSQNRFNNLRFRAVYSEASAGCGGTFESLSGTFVSPDYPNMYPIDSECVWMIKTAPGHRAMLSFSVFDLVQSDYCNEDYVEVRENDEGGRFIGRFCGQVLPENLTASHQLWIKFRSNGQDVGQGFVASYSLLYRSSLSGTSGQIANPLYPHAFRGFGTYEWTVTAPIGMFIEVSFLELDLLHYEYSRTCVASLTFYDGPDATGSELFNYCGAILQSPVRSHGNQMHILFNSRHALSSSGSTFLLGWNATVDRYVPVTEISVPRNRTSDCDGVINIEDELVHSVQSPGFPNGYSANKKCQWLVTTPIGTVVTFNLFAVDLEGYYGCYSDYVEIFGGSAVPSEWISLGRYCSRSHIDTSVKSGTNAMTITFISDYSYNGTGFSATLHAMCGGNISAPSGSIQTPNYPNNYHENDNCDWLISVRPGRTISLQFEEFQLEGNMPTCHSDNILFRNGRSNESPLLGSGKYCGSSVPNIPDTTSNHLLVRFVSNPSFTFKGFKLLFSEVSLECGGLKMLSQSVTSIRINTPNYPSSYPVQTECEWTIIAPSQRRVLLDFEEHFDIPFEQDCVVDYVIVHDGGTTHAPVLGRFCGHDLPSSLQATGNTMFVRFSSVDTHPSIGFRATVKIADCGGTIFADSGVITSPHYPHGYAAGLDCEWIVRATQGHFLILTVVDIQTSVTDWTNVNCSSSDVLQIRDFNSTGSLLGEFCGEENPSSVATADHVAYVRFMSRRNSPLMRGFRLSFNISAEECGGEFTTTTGVITSPNYPRFYPNHRQCIWQIYAPYGRLVRLTFTHFDLEAQRDHMCPDFVGAFNTMDYERDYSLLPPYYMCGVNLPEVITSGSNFMLLKFISNQQNSATGFRAVYDTDLEFECGGGLPLPSGNLISPGFELGNYTHNLDCQWYLNAPHPNATFVFKINHLVIEMSPNYFRSGLCQYDRLEILSGLDVRTAFSFASYCGNRSDVIVFAVPFSQLIVRFKTDSSVVYTGFNLSYSMSDCGGGLTEAGVVTSPGYPLEYGNDVVCAWVVTFQEGQQVQITFEDFTVENSDGCTADYVVVHNGMSSNSPIIGKYCGSEKPRDIKSHRHDVLIEFHSNSASVASGFRIALTPVSSGCGGVISGEIGQIKSVGYPDKYPSNVECEWLFEGDPGFYLNLTFIGRFDLEMSPVCDRDFVEGFHFIDGNWVSLGRRCGRDVPLPYITKTPRFRLLFRTNEGIDGDGFNANWTETCGGIFTESVGVITSPEYPEVYPVDVVCVYVISADPSHYVILEFDNDFKLEDSPPDCVYDVIRIYSGNNTEGTQLSETCGETPPPRISSLGAVTIQFRSDGSVTYKGFHARYRISECGGVFNHSTEPVAHGLVSSPTHPDHYHSNMNCTWVIQVHSDRIVQFKFQEFNVEQGSSNCVLDYVALYDGNDTASPLLGRFCGWVIPDVVFTSGSFLTVQFITDDVVELTGFRGVFTSTFGANQGCRGVLNTTFGTVQSLDFDGDGKYEPGLECQWTIIGASFKVMRLTFHTFDVEKPTDRDGCPWDYLEVRDGPSSDYTLIERLCGSVMPNPIVASTNQLWLKFVSDDVEVKAGFQATFESIDPICGGVLTAMNISQSIQSPNYPEDYPINVRCLWTLSTPSEQEFIEVQFVQFDLESSYRCSKDSLTVQPINTDYYLSSYTVIVYCGHSMPSNYYTQDDSPLRVQFISDSSVAGRGFQLNYQLASCNRTYNNPYGIIRDKLADRAPTSDMSCIIKIVVPENRTISIGILDYYTNRRYETRNCEEAYLQIRDGSAETDPLLGILCGTGILEPLSSTGNSIWLKWHVSPGLFLKFTALYYSTTQGKGCGGEIVASMGKFVSPNYPGNYTRDAVCRWTVMVPHNRIAIIHFNQFDIRSSENCTGSYVQIFDSQVESDSHLLNTFCETDYPGITRTTGNSFVVKYVTNPQNVGTGFKIDFYSTPHFDAEEIPAYVPRLQIP